MSLSGLANNGGTAPPNGPAGGDLGGNLPSPTVLHLSHVTDGSLPSSGIQAVASSLLTGNIPPAWLGSDGTHAAAGNDARFTAYGTHAAKPVAAAANASSIYFETDTGHAFLSNGTTWTQIAPGPSDAPNGHAATHEVGGADDLYMNRGDRSIHRLETLDREWSNQAIATVAAGATSTLFLAFFTASLTLTATQLRVFSNSATTYGSTGGYCAIGLYTISAGTPDAPTTLTLVASTTNDTTVLTVGGTAYSRAISGPSGITSYVLTAGVRYALGVICVTGTGGSPSPGTIIGVLGVAVVMGTPPIRATSLTGQSSLPSSIVYASCTASGKIPYLAAVDANG